MVTFVPPPLSVTEIKQRHEIKQRDLRAFTHTVAYARRQIEIDHALLEASRIICEQSREMIRQTRETLARVRLSMEALRISKRGVSRGRMETSGVVTMKLPAGSVAAIPLKAI